MSYPNLKLEFINNCTNTTVLSIGNEVRTATADQPWLCHDDTITPRGNEGANIVDPLDNAVLVTWVFGQGSGVTGLQIQFVDDSAVTQTPYPEENPAYYIFTLKDDGMRFMIQC